MLITIFVALTGLLLFLVPIDKPAGDKTHKIGFILLFCGVFFLLAALSGKSLRVSVGPPQLDGRPAGLQIENWLTNPDPVDKRCEKRELPLVAWERTFPRRRH